MYTLAAVFSDLLTDRVTLVKKSGQRFEDIRASVQNGKIFTDDPQVPIEDGDHFERVLPSGVREVFTVVDAGFYQGSHGMPSHYESKVRKGSAEPIPTPGSAPGAQVINLTGPNARVNIQSSDSSTNVMSGESLGLFDDLRAAIGEASLDEGEARRLIKSINEMQAAVGTTSFAERYKGFMEAAANHMTVVGHWLPALAQLLAG